MERARRVLGSWVLKVEESCLARHPEHSKQSLRWMVRIPMYVHTNRGRDSIHILLHVAITCENNTATRWCPHMRAIRWSVQIFHDD